MKLFNALVAAVLMTLPLATFAEDVPPPLDPSSQTAEDVAAEAVTVPVPVMDGSTLLDRIANHEARLDGQERTALLPDDRGSGSDFDALGGAVAPRVMRTWPRTALPTLGAVASAFADDSRANLTVGARVRITAPTVSSERMTGRLLRSPGDFLEIALKDGMVKAVPVASIAKLQISSGKKRHVLQGALAGALLAAGYALLAPGCTTEFCGDDDYRTLVLIVLGGGGTALGAAVGAAIKTERWTAIPTPRSTVRGPSAPALSVSVRF